MCGLYIQLSRVRNLRSMQTDTLLIWILLWAHVLSLSDTLKFVDLTLLSDASFACHIHWIALMLPFQKRDSLTVTFLEVTTVRWPSPQLRRRRASHSAIFTIKRCLPALKKSREGILWCNPLLGFLRNYRPETGHLKAFWSQSGVFLCIWLSLRKPSVYIRLCHFRKIPRGQSLSRSLRLFIVPKDILWYPPRLLPEFLPPFAFCDAPSLPSFHVGTHAASFFRTCWPLQIHTSSNCNDPSKNQLRSPFSLKSDLPHLTPW